MSSPAKLRVETKDLLWGAVGASLYVGKRRVGEIVAEKRSGQLVVRRAVVRPAYQRRGFGTKGYEALATWACANGFTLTSDSSRTDASEGFWRKQVQKGRAEYDPEERRYRLTSCGGDLGRARRR